MKKIKAYQTSDGQIFKIQRDAEKHDARLAAIKYFDDNGYFGPTGSDNGAELVTFLEEHQDILSAFLKPNVRMAQLKSELNTVEEINDRYERYIETAQDTFSFWICPKCDTLAHPDYKCQDCGYDNSKGGRS